jgi:hypothetical protein
MNRINWNSFNRQTKVWRFFFILVFGFVFLMPKSALAHQTPSSNVFLDVNTKTVGVLLQIPVSELALAYDTPVFSNATEVFENQQEKVKEYILDHIQLYISKEKPWAVEFKNMKIVSEEEGWDISAFYELEVQLVFTPNEGESTRVFNLKYDAVMHQVNNHVATVVLRNDWENGVIDANSVLCVIRNDTATNVNPYKINLESGSIWKGFEGMFWLGVSHIKEGTDHLLFIITLLLPACLLVENRKWTVYGGLKNSILKLLKIITAFTIGHSVTLAIGALGTVPIPIQWIEITIAFSILVSAIHAVKPIFYGKEFVVAMGFGLIHGLAFSETLQNMHLLKTDLIVSLLGFNLGIEFMQIIVILITIPWFVIMSKTMYFKYVKNSLAILVGLASIGWIIQRITASTNVLSEATDALFVYSPEVILGLALLSIFLFLDSKFEKQH